MSEVWSLPGYDVRALLGSGSTGEVWRARELATGDTVALKRLRPGADPAAVEALRREAALLRGLDTPYVVRLREVVGSGAEAVLVLDHAAGGSLAALLAHRGSLDPGEVVTIGGPLAQALAAAHAGGLVHGDVRPANVLFRADGMPLLSDLGLARVAGERRSAVPAGGEPGAAADVWALAALCHHMLAGAPAPGGPDVSAVPSTAACGSRTPLGLLAPAAPRALVEAVEAGLAADPATRPDAAALASLLLRAHPAAPVRLIGGPSTAEPVPGVGRPQAAPAGPVAPALRGTHQAALLGLALVVLLLVGGTLGWLSGRSAVDAAPALPPAAAAVSVPPSVEGELEAAPRWDQVLDDLDAARAQAFSRGDVTALTAVYAPGSPGLAADTALLQGLVDEGATAHGLRHAVRAVEVLETSPDAARLRVVDVLAAYEIRDATGAVISRAAARDERTFVAALTRTPAGWRLLEVRPVG